MIFSSAKWNNAAEIRPFISIAVSTEFSSVEAFLKNAFDMFVSPLLGDTLKARLLSIYSNQVNATDKEKQFLQLAQKANALMAFWFDYDERQMFIDENGTYRLESESLKTPYKYQEENIKSALKLKGFNSLDELLLFLEKNIDVFTEFKDSTAYSQSRKELVRNAGEIDRYYFINNSRLIYLRLRPHIRIITDTVISQRLGSTIYDAFIADLESETPSAKYISLREKLIPVITFMAIARLIRETGSLTDKGLYFDSLKASDNAYNSEPAPDQRMISQADRFEADALSYWMIAEKYLTSDFEYAAPSMNRVPTRDNNDKKAFWG